MTWSFPEKTDPSRHSVRFGAQEVDERNAKLLQTLSEATDMLAKADEMQVIFGGPEGERCVFSRLFVENHPGPQVAPG